MDYKKINFEELESNLMALDDAFIMNSLLRCAIDYPTIFSLIWGDRMAEEVEFGFPPELRKIVGNIIQEEEKKRSSLDPQEKRIHNIIVDLLHLLYKKQIAGVVEQMTNSESIEGT